jgi:hypothetical protein
MKNLQFQFFKNKLDQFQVWFLKFEKKNKILILVSALKIRPGS